MLAQQAGEIVRIVLGMLSDHGMDVVFVGDFNDGPRRFRVVEALSHGRAAALATGQADRDQPAGALLQVPVMLHDGRVFGMLCCFSDATEATARERDLRTLRHGARLTARLLDNEQVLRQLAQSIRH